MKRKDKKYFTGILLGFFIVCLFFSFFSMDAESFKNSLGVNNYALTVENYQAGYSMHDTPTMTDYFGTHDWIAESALLILKENRLSLTAASRDFVDLLFPFTDSLGNTLLYHFLLGTEAPDAYHAVSSKIKLIDCKGRSYGTAKTDTTVMGLNHHIYIDGIIPYTSPAADGAHHCYMVAIQALQEGDCKKAAFFLGAMCHYIGDMGSYFHIIDSSIQGNPSKADCSTYKPTWEKYISWLTWRPTRFRGSNQEVDFFSISLAKSMFNPSVGDRAWLGAYKAALFTTEQNENMWLYDQFVDNGDYLFDGFNIYATSSLNRERILPYTRENFPKPSDDTYAYFKKVEDCINNAIRYCAEAINLAATNFVGCDCGGGSSSLPKLTQTDPTTLLQENMVIQTYFVVWGFTSVFSSLYAISLTAATSKLKDLIAPVIT